MARVVSVSSAQQTDLTCSPIRCLGHALVLAGLTLAGAQSGAAEGPPDTMAAQLSRMAAAVDGLNYEGTLVYLADNRLETLHIVHRVDGDRVEERLISLSGPVRAVARQEHEVTCALSGDQPISVKRRQEVPELLRPRAIDPDTVAANYFVHPLGEIRVAGRDTDVVGIIPRDDYRFGYRFYLDRETGLPLKSDLMGTQGDPIEQIMFAAIQVAPASGHTPDAVVPDAAEVRPGSTGEAAPPPIPSGVQPLTGPWRFHALPPGFAVRMHDSVSEGDAGPVEHFLVTDHLASVSVFVEGLGATGLAGATRIGGVHALGGRVDGHQVTVVGQVPAGTLEAVLAALHRNPGARP
jgi:sigma-E factor negative regulatory protein RseB